MDDLIGFFKSSFYQQEGFPKRGPESEITSTHVVMELDGKFWNGFEFTPCLQSAHKYNNLDTAYRNVKDGYDREVVFRKGQWELLTYDNAELTSYLNNIVESIMNGTCELEEFEDFDYGVDEPEK